MVIEGVAMMVLGTVEGFGLLRIGFLGVAAFVLTYDAVTFAFRFGSN